MNTTAAAELAQHRTRFRDWEIIRTRCGTIIARHRISGEAITAASLVDLEDRLNEWATRH